MTATSRADCPDGDSSQFTVGVADDFALPFEDVFPRPELAEFITGYLGHPIRTCDEPGPNLTVGHTFTSLPDGICAATLELHLRADVGGSSNDTVSLEFLEDAIPGQDPVWGWGLFISTITGLNWELCGAVQYVAVAEISTSRVEDLPATFDVEVPQEGDRKTFRRAVRGQQPPSRAAHNPSVVAPIWDA